MSGCVLCPGLLFCEGKNGDYRTPLSCCGNVLSPGLCSLDTLVSKQDVVLPLSIYFRVTVKSLVMALVLCSPSGFLDYLHGLVLNPLFYQKKKKCQFRASHFFSHKYQRFCISFKEFNGFNKEHCSESV